MSIPDPIYPIHIRTSDGWEQIAYMGPQGPPGPAGPAGPAGSSYVHTQSALASTWVVTHGLNLYPSITVVDTGNSVILPDVHYDSANQLTLTFGAPTSGKAYLN